MIFNQKLSWFILLAFMSLHIHAANDCKILLYDLINNPIKHQKHPEKLDQLKNCLNCYSDIIKNSNSFVLFDAIIKSNNLPIVKILLDLGANPNQQNTFYKQSAMDTIMLINRLPRNILKLLIQYGGNPDLFNETSQTTPRMLNPNLITEIENEITQEQLEKKSYQSTYRLQEKCILEPRIIKFT